MKYIKMATVLVLVAYAMLFSGTNSRIEQCTSAVISNLATAEGVPLLWKNRDTGVLSNKVVYVKDEPYCYLALVNADEKYLVVTNYARSGKPTKGAGYLRFERASELFQGLPKNRISFRDILTRFTRDLGHVLIKNPSLTNLKNLPADKDFWIYSRDCINSPITSAAVVISGKNPSGQNSLATMWVIPGEPLCAIAIPLWVEAGSPPEALWKGEEAPMWKESLRIKDIIRPYKEGNKEDYLNLTRLDNADGTGFLPEILKTEEEIIKMTSEFLKKEHSPEKLAAFQAKMAQKALATLRSIQ